jgi:hypothetical protein
MEKTIVHYKLKPGKVEENEKLVQAVYQELHEQAPEAFSYATYKLPDGVSFVHIAINNTNEKSPLSGLAAFKAFQAGIKDRCDEQPVVSAATEIGSYGFAFASGV